MLRSPHGARREVPPELVPSSTAPQCPRMNSGKRGDDGGSGNDVTPKATGTHRAASRAILVYFLILPAQGTAQSLPQRRSAAPDVNITNGDISIPQIQTLFNPTWTSWCKSLTNYRLWRGLRCVLGAALGSLRLTLTTTHSRRWSLSNTALMNKLRHREPVSWPQSNGEQT